MWDNSDAPSSCSVDPHSCELDSGGAIVGISCGIMSENAGYMGAIRVMNVLDGDNSGMWLPAAAAAAAGA